MGKRTRTANAVTLAKSAAFLFLVAATLIGCNKYVDKTGGHADMKLMEPSQYKAFCYDLLYTAVLAPRCLECHSTEKKNQPDLSSYAKLMRYVKPGDPLGSDLLLSLQGMGGDMPNKRAPLGPNQMSYIELWIASGAPEEENQGKEPVNVPPLKPLPPIQIDVDPTYSSLYKNVFSKYCLDCHTPHKEDGKDKDPAAGLDLTSYQTLIESTTNDDDAPMVDIKSPKTSPLFKVMNTGAMPKPKTKARLSHNVADAILNWITNGAKND